MESRIQIERNPSKNSADTLSKLGSFYDAAIPGTTPKKRHMTLMNAALPTSPDNMETLATIAALSRNQPDSAGNRREVLTKDIITIGQKIGSVALAVCLYLPDDLEDERRHYDALLKSHPTATITTAFPYVPHITLARFSTARHTLDEIDNLKREAAEKLPHAITLERVRVRVDSSQATSVKNVARRTTTARGGAVLSHRHAHHNRSA